jgi:transposase, IS5 family
VTDASRHDGRMLRRGLLDGTNTGTTVWADSAYRSKANEAFMERHGFRSQVHHRKPKGRPMPSHIRRGNASRSKVRAIEHVFALQKGPMALCIRTIGIARAKAKIGLANLVYNIRRLVFHERIAAAA